ncbi:MAG TPA: DnaJ domain-containing protein [Polyangiaceae bacterium]
MPDAAFTPDEEALLAETVDIDVDTRRRILLLHRSLDRSDHYTLLGVDRAADKKAIKRAYYDLAAKLHPDRYFRKNLGPFKSRMEAVFGRLSLAHETLTSAEKRAEYDAYLEEQRRSRGIEELLADALAEVKRAEETAEREARAAASSPSQPNMQAVTAPAAAPQPPKPSAVEVSAAARRDALARRLLGGARAGSSPSAPSMPAAAKPSAPAAPPVPTTAGAMEALRNRYELRKSQARDAQARKYVAAGEAALASNDPVSAANAFRVAASLAPNDEALQKRADDAQIAADRILADTYAKQAHYEEKNGQWTEAARSWMRVVKGRPQDAHANERAANAMVKAGGDLHEASRLAQQACALKPENHHYRVTLANVYLAAGLTLNARRELETAAQRAPHDDTIQAMLKRVAKSA